MYEIRAHIDTHDLDPTGADIDPAGLDIVLGVHHDLDGAYDDADAIAEETELQLAANGEGHRDFGLHLTLTDTSTGTVLIYPGIGHIPG